MTALVPITPTNTGAASAGAGVAASDTIARSVMGPKGAYLEILNGNAATDNMTISDAGSTDAGNPLAGGTTRFRSSTAPTRSSTSGRSRSPRAPTWSPSPHSVTATVTYKLYPVG